MGKPFHRLLLLASSLAMLSACSATSDVCTKPGAALNQLNEQLFFIDNAKQAGVQKSAHGYQYLVVNRGRGTEHASPGDSVLVNYVTRSLNGSVIDSGYSVSMPVSKVIKGWQLALSEMVEGDSWKLYVPAKLAYGCKSQPSNSGYDEALMFELELLKIQ